MGLYYWNNQLVRSMAMFFFIIFVFSPQSDDNRRTGAQHWLLCSIYLLDMLFGNAERCSGHMFVLSVLSRPTIPPLFHSSSDFDSEHDRFHRLRRDKIDNVDRSGSWAWQCSWYAPHRQSQWFLRCVDFAFHLIVRGPASIILSEVHQRENGKF